MDTIFTNLHIRYGLVLAVWALVFLAIYLVPMFVAWRRRHNNLLPIAITNVVLGWSILGWFVALVWATTDNRKSPLN